MRQANRGLHLAMAQKDSSKFAPYFINNLETPPIFEILPRFLFLFSHDINMLRILLVIAFLSR
jgi:hypothetical protein